LDTLNFKKNKSLHTQRSEGFLNKINMETSKYFAAWKVGRKAGGYLYSSLTEAIKDVRKTALSNKEKGFKVLWSVEDLALGRVILKGEMLNK